MGIDRIVVATLPGSSSRLLARGRNPEPLSALTALDESVRETTIAGVARAVEQKTVSDTVHRGARVIARPYSTPQGIVTAVSVWSGAPDEQPPSELPTGAWVWDIDRGTCLASPEIHRVYRMPSEDSVVEISRAQSMYGVTAAAEEQEAALQAAFAGEPGFELTHEWKIERYDGRLRRMVWAARMTSDSDGHRWLHGITVDLTEGDGRSLLTSI
ncbi:GAF domain-containing protein [Nocardia sp. NPDC051570]|uniref:GAF domain-containing protein n=1 Tax=Nocardia sp. NPDC051570 TaxID=3364324 RepID=UPI00379A1151